MSQKRFWSANKKKQKQKQKTIYNYGTFAYYITCNENDWSCQEASSLMICVFSHLRTNNMDTNQRSFYVYHSSKYIQYFT